MYKKRFFLLFKRFFFFSWNWIKPSDWIYSGQPSDWRIELRWTRPQQWRLHGPNLRWGSDLLTWICPDWKEVSGKADPCIVYLPTSTETYSAPCLAPAVATRGSGHLLLRHKERKSSVQVVIAIQVVTTLAADVQSSFQWGSFCLKQFVCHLFFPISNWLTALKYFHWNDYRNSIKG